MTKRELTLKLIEALGPFHAQLNLSCPSLWTDEVVADDLAEEAIEAAEALRTDFGRGLQQLH